MFNYGAGYLTCNARLWFIESLEAGKTFLDLSSMRNALARVCGLLYNQEQCHLNLLFLKQSLSSGPYLTEFSRISLQVSEIDELSRGLLYEWSLFRYQATCTCSSSSYVVAGCKIGTHSPACCWCNPR